jgi:small subunit ribosomal protein S14
MARAAVIQRNLKRERMVLRYAEKRAQYRAIIRDMKVNEEEREAAQVALQKLPRNAMPVRVRRRCEFHGRGRGVYRKFGICRNKLRESAMFGAVPGLVKASW